MGKCKNCFYWREHLDEMYGEEFGDCLCEKIVYYEDLKDEKTYELDKEKLNNSHVIYEDSEGLAAELRVNKEFGCINFKNKKILREDKKDG